MNRNVLWMVLIVSAVVNVVASRFDGTGQWVGGGFGVVALACAAGLIRDHYRRRSSSH
jgi:hypothetical protein